MPPDLCDGCSDQNIFIEMPYMKQRVGPTTILEEALKEAQI
jgi:TPP-dependent indolepyruvate ferredoxin oxidoreductase alpha subunit